VVWVTPGVETGFSEHGVARRKIGMMMVPAGVRVLVATQP
jgi:hypothetical protein